MGPAWSAGNTVVVHQMLLSVYLPDITDKKINKIKLFHCGRSVL